MVNFAFAEAQHLDGCQFARAFGYVGCGKREQHHECQRRCQEDDNVHNGIDQVERLREFLVHLLGTGNGKEFVAFSQAVGECLFFGVAA